MNKYFVILLLVVASVISAGATTHRALIFGLGAYQDKTWGKIHGDTDVYYVQQMLSQAGFTDIVTLKNEKATKQGMVRAFIDLAKRCNKGDVVYVHYSGHGQLMTDLDGDEALRSNARHAQWDEAWIPYDAYMHYGPFDRGEKHFCDDEVEFYLSAIRDRIGKNGRMYVVVDACHSGDATRGEDEECVRGVDVKFNIPRTATSANIVQAKQERWLSISACKPYQLAMEMPGTNVGKLTFALYSIGRKIFSMNLGELQSVLNTYMEMNRGRLPQNPVVSGQR